MIEKSPFRIGRAESCDLRVDSAQVSREHAELLDRGGVWFVRDLGSTNGTLLNGKKVGETLLSDGDILKVAETELTFSASPTSQFKRMVTQPIQARDPGSSALPAIPAEIAAARALAEATLWQAIPVELSPAVSLRNGTVEAVFGNISTSRATTDALPFAQSHHVAAARSRELSRLRAVEIALARGVAERLFVSIDGGEIEAHRRLFAELEQLHDLLSLDSELGITVPLRAILETAQAVEFHRAVRDCGALLAYDGFQGNAEQVMQLAAIVPDYLLLSEDMTKGLPDRRAPLHVLESVLADCDELGIKPVLPRCSCEHAIQQCREVGFDLAIEHSPTPRKPKRPATVAAM